MRPRDCRTAADVDALGRALFGGRDLAGGAGVVHVTAVWAPPAGGALVTLKIGPHTPKSEHDFFALNLARARTDAIVMTGKMLRDEPHTRYDLQGPGALAEALAAWRSSRAGRDAPPWLVVLTRGRDLPLAHPALHGWPRPIVYTTRDGAGALSTRLSGSDIDVLGVDAPSVRGAIAHLRDERGAERITIEAGPSTSRGLYSAPVAVDELMLTVYREPALDPRVQGPPLLPLDALRGALPHATPEVVVTEPSGAWAFQLLRRV